MVQTSSLLFLSWQEFCRWWIRDPGFSHLVPPSSYTILSSSTSSWNSAWRKYTCFLFFFFLVLPVYCYQPISLHPRAHMLSHIIPWTSACQTPLSMDFSRQKYWSGLPFPSPTHAFLIALVQKLLLFSC